MGQVAAIILAAGESSRLGKPKQLLEFKGKTLVRRAVDAANGAKCSPIIVVTGGESPDIDAELQCTTAIVASNKDWKSGIGSSIRRGIQHLLSSDKDIDAVVILVCDQPFVDSTIVNALIARRGETGKPIVASGYANTLGVPAIFDRSLFSALAHLSNASGAKSLILQNQDDVAGLPFPEGKIDIDTIEEWNLLDRRLPA